MNTIKPNICIIAGMLLGMVGCQTVEKTDKEWLFFPAPPENPRIQFLTWASGAEQVEPTRDSFESFVLGDEPTAARHLVKPYGVAAFEGVVYVCDTKALAIVRLDFKEQRYSIFGDRGPGRLRKPINIVIDPLGYKFVADPVRKQIVAFGPDDKYVTAYDIPEPCRPVDVAVFENELFVLDNDQTCQIVVLDRKSGKVLRTIGKPGGEPGEFKIPNSIDLDSEGNIYISDTHNWRVQKLSPQGEPIWSKGTPGYMLGQFGRPRGIRVGPDNIVYVVDGATEIVQMFNSDGDRLMRFGGPGNVPGALGLPASVAIDKTSIKYFKKYLHKDFTPESLIFVASQYGQYLINVYAFGSFPEGYDYGASNMRELPSSADEKNIGPVEVAPKSVPAIDTETKLIEQEAATDKAAN